MNYNELPEALQEGPNHPDWAIEEGAQLARQQRTRIAIRIGLAVAAIASIVALASVIGGAAR